MPHWRQRGWGIFPSSKIMAVSLTCRWKKWTRIAVFVVARPGHPSMWQLQGPWWSGRPSYRYVAHHQGPWLPNSVSHPLPSNAVSACGPPATQAPSSPRTMCTAPDPAASPSRNIPLPSSVSHTPPPTAFPPPGTGGRPFRLSCQRWYSGLPCRKALPRC